MKCSQGALSVVGRLAAGKIHTLITAHAANDMISHVSHVLYNYSEPRLDTYCADDESYISPVNSKFGCEIYNGTVMDCSEWSALLNTSQLEDAIRRCPVACGVLCV